MLVWDSPASHEAGNGSDDQNSELAPMIPAMTRLGRPKKLHGKGGDGLEGDAASREIVGSEPMAETGSRRG